MGLSDIFLREDIGQWTLRGQLARGSKVTIEGVLLLLLREQAKFDAAHCRLHAVGDSELADNPVYVLLDGARAYQEGSGDLLVGIAACH
jgi:hypothetical protein